MKMLEVSGLVMGHGLAPKNLKKIIGKTAIKNLEVGTPLNLKHVNI